MYSLAVAILAMFIAAASAFAQTSRGHMGNRNTGGRSHMSGAVGHGMTGPGVMGRDHTPNRNAGANSHMGRGTIDEAPSQKGQSQGFSQRPAQQRDQNPNHR